MSTKASSGNNIDAKREEFRKYLEKEGVLEYLTKQLVNTLGSNCCLRFYNLDKPTCFLSFMLLGEAIRGSR